MNIPAEHILLVESNPEIQALIAHQSLRPLGYQVEAVPDVDAALAQAAELMPDLVIVGLDLGGLSGKDLLVAFNAQGIQVPVIVIADKKQENAVVQAFRLGAVDYLLWPAREAEIISAVERALKQVRESRARQRLDLQLKEINQELRRVRELTATFNIGKLILSITDQDTLFDKVVERVMYITDADYAWVLVREGHEQAFILAAQTNLPGEWAGKLGQPLNDGISSQVVLSGETLAMNGKQLDRLEVASLGLAAMAAPVKIEQEVVGVLVVVRKKDQVFETPMQSILSAVANYVSISLANAYQIQSLREAAETAQANEQKLSRQFRKMQRGVRSIAQSITSPIDQLLGGEVGELTLEQQQILKAARSALEDAALLAEDERPAPATADPSAENG